MNANEMVLAYLKREDIPVKRLADYLKKTPQNMGKMLNSGYMAIETLESISDALKHDFFYDLSINWQRKHFSVESVVMEKGEKYRAPASFDEYLNRLIEQKIKERLKK